MSCGSTGTSTGASFGNVKRATGVLVNYGTSTRLTIDTGGGIATVNIIRVKLDHTAGSAVSFVPRIYNVSGGAAGTLAQQFEGSSTSVAALFDVVASGVVFQTDPGGQFYLEPGPNAGVDNNFSYDLYYEVL